MGRERPAAPSRGSGEAPLGGAYLEAVASRVELAKRLRDVWEHLTKLSQVRFVACGWAGGVVWCGVVSGWC